MELRYKGRSTVREFSCEDLQRLTRNTIELEPVRVDVRVSRVVDVRADVAVALIKLGEFEPNKTFVAPPPEPSPLPAHLDPELGKMIPNDPGPIHSEEEPAAPAKRRTETKKGE